MFDQTKAGSRRNLVLCLLVLFVVTVVIALPFKFGVRAAVQEPASGLTRGIRTESNDPHLPNYDIRSAEGDGFIERARTSAGKDASVIADIRDGFVRGEDALRARVPSLKIEYNNDIRIPE